MRWQCGECKALLGNATFTAKAQLSRFGYCPRCQHSTWQQAVIAENNKEEIEKKEGELNR